MNTKEYTTIDRRAMGWPAGEWDSEPDKVQWPDADTGLPCLAVRNPRSGHWCGYVGVSEEHPWHGKGYEEVTAEAHGGLTFADKCRPGEDESRGICHVPAPGEPDHVWWFGFDCAHFCDRSPLEEAYAQTRGYPFQRMADETYKTLDYVKRECNLLALQISEAAA